MICKKCKKEIPESSIFCMYCGRKQETDRSIGKKKRGNGTGSIRKLPNGKYKAIITLALRVENGKIKRKCATKTFDKKSDAIMGLPLLIDQYKQSSYAAMKDATIHDLYMAYTSTKEYDGLSKSQQNKMGYAYNRLEEIDYKGISTLTVADLQDLVDAQTEKYYPARDMKVLLSHLYGIAMKREIVHMNKSELIDLPDAPTAKRLCWSK